MEKMGSEQTDSKQPQMDEARPSENLSYGEGVRKGQSLRKEEDNNIVLQRN